MDPSCRENLWNIVTKVARYREAVRLLYRMAKRFLVVRRVRAISTDLPEDAFVRLPRDGYMLCLLSTLARIKEQNNMPQAPERIF